MFVYMTIKIIFIFRYLPDKNIELARNMSVYPVNTGSWLDQLSSDPPAIDFGIKYEIVNYKGHSTGPSWQSPTI